MSDQQNERHEHLDVNVSRKDVFGWNSGLQLLAGLAAIAGVYTTLTNNITKLESEVTQLKIDQVRIETAQKDTRSEIRAELSTITYEIRELRSELLKRQQQR